MNGPGTGSKMPEQRTESEQVFEAYLKARRLKAEHEPQIAGKTKHPDYRVIRGKQPLYFEVKEFQWNKPLPRGGAYHPTAAIREKIDAARKKFKEFKESPCTLVLYKVFHPDVNLTDPRTIFAAMLGDYGFQFRINTTTGTAIEDPHAAFLGGGKMIRPHPREPQNTSINALVTLEQYPLGWQCWRLAEARAQQGQRRRHPPTNRISQRAVPRVIVHDNPFANHPLPSKLFRGPYDERWTWTNGILRQTYAGDLVDALETTLHALGWPRR